MNSFKSLVFIFTTVKLLWGAPVAESSACSHELRIAWHDYKPFSYLRTGSDVPSGLDIDILRSLMNELDCDFRLIPMSWEQTLIELNGGRIDMSMYASRTPERDRVYRFSVPYRTQQAVLAVRSDSNISIETLEDILRLDITVAADIHAYRGEQFAEVLKKAQPNKFIHVSEVESGLRMLLSERVDALVDDKDAMTEETEILGVSSRLKLLPVEIYNDDIHFIFNKNVPASLVTEVNSVLSRR